LKLGETERPSWGLPPGPPFSGNVAGSCRSSPPSTQAQVPHGPSKDAVQRSSSRPPGARSGAAPPPRAGTQLNGLLGHPWRDSGGRSARSGGGACGGGNPAGPGFDGAGQRIGLSVWSQRRQGRTRTRLRAPAREIPFSRPPQRCSRSARQRKPSSPHRNNRSIAWAIAQAAGGGSLRTGGHLPAR